MSQGFGTPPQTPGGDALSNLVNASTNTTAAAGDVVFVDTTSGPVTITLPTTPAALSQVVVKKVNDDSGASAVTVVAHGSGLIDRASDYVITDFNGSATFQNLAADTWKVISEVGPVSAQSGGVFFNDEDDSPTQGAAPWVWYPRSTETGDWTGDTTVYYPDQPATAPGQVTNLVATAGDAQVALDWDAPASNGGSAITTYLVEYRTPAGSGSYTTFAHGASTTSAITVTGLTDDSEYEFRVSAVNAVGTGTPSATATATPVAAPVDFDWSSAGTLVGAWLPEGLPAPGAAAAWTITDGTAGNWTQADGAKQPVVQAAAVDGLAALLFTATDFDEMDLASPVALTALSGLTVFVVYKTTGHNTILSDTGKEIFIVGDSSTNRLQFYDGASFPTSDTFTRARTAWNIGVVKRSGSTVSWYEGATARNTGTASADVSVSRLGIGDSFANPVDGLIAAVVIYSNALDDTNRGNVTSALAALFPSAVA